MVCTYGCVSGLVAMDNLMESADASGREGGSWHCNELRTVVSSSGQMLSGCADRVEEQEPQQLSEQHMSSN
jgi:hypothetical protein